MRHRYEFTFHTLAAVPDGQDERLAHLGSVGWEMRGIATQADGSMVVALQRAMSEEALPDATALAAQLEVPLTAPVLDDANEVLES